MILVQKNPARRRVSVGQCTLAGVLLIYTLFCLLPLLLVVIVSFSSKESVDTIGCSFFPRSLSLEGYQYVLSYGSQLLSSYGVTIFVTVVGTALGLLVMSMYAYALSKRDFRLRRFLSLKKVMTFFIFFPMLFSGGQLATYMIYTSVYGLKDSIWSLILPMTVSTMNIVILRTYIQSSIPESLCEAAKIDGAVEFRILFQIVIPLMKPALAAVGFMMATAYWNDWYNGLLYITSASKTPLQLLLVRIQNNMDFILQSAKLSGGLLNAAQKNLPQTSATMAVVVTVIGPIILAYPFFQKYLVKGLTVGSVKG